MKKQEKTSQSFAELQRGEISLDEINVKFNFRKDFNSDRLQELADNIAKVGVLQPVILRGENGQKILVAGERRYRAAKMAGLKTIPYRLLNLTAEEALEVTALENLHRADLNPIEEAQSFKTLLDSGNYQVEDVAERVNKSKAYVYRAVRLLDLSQEAQDALVSGKITSGHARHLLRLNADECKKMLKEILKNGLSIKELTEKIEWLFGLSLKEAAFPTSTPYADCPPCRNCPHNSSNQQDLFEEEIEKGRCTNAQCFKKKHDFLLDEQKNKARKEAQVKGFVYYEDKYGYNNCHWFENYPVLSDEEIKSLKKELSEHPGDFGIGVNKKDAKTYIFAVSDEMIQLLGKLRGEEDVDDDAEEEYDIEQKKSRFVHEKTEEFILQALPVFQYTPQNEDIENILPFSGFNEQQKEYVCKLLGVKDCSVESFKTFTREQIIAAMVLDQIVDYWQFSECICNLAGIDYEALEADCKKRAENAWQNETKN